jgi:hypothetical protein
MVLLRLQLSKRCALVPDEPEEEVGGDPLARDADADSDLGFDKAQNVSRWGASPLRRRRSAPLQVPGGLACFEFREKCELGFGIGIAQMRSPPDYAA